MFNSYLNIYLYIVNGDNRDKIDLLDICIPINYPNVSVSATGRGHG